MLLFYKPVKHSTITLTNVPRFFTANGLFIVKYILKTNAKKRCEETTIPPNPMYIMRGYLLGESNCIYNTIIHRNAIL